MDGREVVIGLVTVVASVIFLVGFVALGWYAVWRLFLCRFGFIRELLGNQQEAGQSSEDTSRPTARSRPSRKLRRD